LELYTYVYREGSGKFYENIQTVQKYVRFEDFTAVTMKNVVSWDVAPCSTCVTQRFGGTYRLHLQDRKSASEETALVCG
jgi:hypothetical protein